MNFREYNDFNDTVKAFNDTLNFFRITPSGFIYATSTCNGALINAVENELKIVKEFIDAHT